MELGLKEGIAEAWLKKARALSGWCSSFLRAYKNESWLIVVDDGGIGVSTEVEKRTISLLRENAETVVERRMRRKTAEVEETENMIWGRKSKWVLSLRKGLNIDFFLYIFW